MPCAEDSEPDENNVEKDNHKDVQSTEEEGAKIAYVAGKSASTLNILCNHAGDRVLGIISQTK